VKIGFVSINENIFECLIAESFEEQSKGLMYYYPPTPVMAFLYKTASINKFWMKNTYADLDIVFSKNGFINQICHGKPMDLSLIGNDLDSDLVVEFPYGTMNSIKATIGSKIKLI